MPWLERLASILATGSGLRIVFQPIVQLSTMRTVGYEALSRFPAPDVALLTSETPQILDSNGYGVGPDLWFKMASRERLLAPLEALAARLALARLPDVPEPLYVAVNASPPSVLTYGFVETLLAHDLRRVVLEITETEPTEDDYSPLLDALAPLRDHGAHVALKEHRKAMRVAVDDIGAGASMSHAFALQADVVKIDMSVIRKVNLDEGRQHLVRGFAGYAHAIGAVCVAEGIETDDEMACVIELGVDLGQGYHPSLGRPEELPVLEAL